ncbi:ribosomal protein S18 acetylase RimI-like enzyme [Blastococcus colisei]|uniref:Ribosomal protein S18 acetylase RimI-like enzyme n=1 Tax=Blastococcus colisei TaxID=1564162 RepID=A0A543PEU9_9ACTN|nr:GNAT family N-acetyltransferase [Blastococcus colisei]TQN42591.1 ribosomal protein S18 acetylase RimI-like enzyme [Blastococcus colisei]
MTSGRSGSEGLPAPLPLDGVTLHLRPAAVTDLPALVALLADDPLGIGRQDAGGDLGPYRRAFELVDGDPAHLLLVAVDGDAVLGTMQLSFIPGLSRRGALRAQIEAVRVAAGARGRGLGAAMIGWAIDESRRRGCALVQLTTDKARIDAQRFYERLGFVASHEGMKLQLPGAS